MSTYGNRTGPACPAGRPVLETYGDPSVRGDAVVTNGDTNARFFFDVLGAARVSVYNPTGQMTEANTNVEVIRGLAQPNLGSLQGLNVKWRGPVADGGRPTAADLAALIKFGWFTLDISKKDYAVLPLVHLPSGVEQLTRISAAPEASSVGEESGTHRSLGSPAQGITQDGECVDLAQIVFMSLQSDELVSGQANWDGGIVLAGGPYAMDVTINGLTRRAI